MRYKLVLVDMQSEKFSLDTEVLMEFDNPEQVESAKTALSMAFTRVESGLVKKGFEVNHQRGPKGRPVYVKAVEEGSATSLQVGDTFPSARALSDVFNIKYNSVAQLLATAAREKKDEAEINGVTFAYVDTLKV